MARFGAVVTAMVTPFAGDSSLDLDAAARLARRLVDTGTDGLVVAGSTGEGAVLTDAEKGDLWRAVVEAVTVPVLAATGTADTAHTMRLTRVAEDAGVAATLVVTPYYNRPPQSGLESHFRAVASVATRPIVLYDIPVRTGRKVSHEVLLRLARDVPLIVGLKDAAADPAATARLVAEAPAGFEVYSGDDALTLPLLAVGAVGVIGVATHWAGPEMGEMIVVHAKGDVERARELNAALMPSYAFETGDAAPNPIPTKVMMGVLGEAVGDCRPPLGPPPAGLDDQARAVLAGLAGRRGRAGG